MVGTAMTLGRRRLIEPVMRDAFALRPDGRGGALPGGQRAHRLPFVRRRLRAIVSAVSSLARRA